MKYLLFIILIVTIDFCIAQTNNEFLFIGQVKNNETQKPLEYLKVSLNNLKYKITDNEGLFSFDNLKKGEYTLQIKNQKKILFDTTLIIDKNLFDLTFYVEFKCSRYNSIKALKDINNGTPFLFLKGGVAPITYSTDDSFEQEFKVKYYDFGCIIPENIDCIIEYNQTILQHLQKMYGNKWKKTIRKDIIKRR